MSARTKMRIGLSIFLIVFVGVFVGQLKAATPSFGFKAVIQSIPSCVVASQHVALPLIVKSTGTVPETITVRLAYVTTLKDADSNSLVIAAGTDHLLGSNGDKHWQFLLQPGQSTTKRLVAYIQPAGNQKASHPLWGFTEFISIKGFEARKPLQIVTRYCSS